MDSTVTAATPELTEIRVHGVGDHNAWSALGTPPIVARTEDPNETQGLWSRINPKARLKRRRWVSLAGPPEPVSHELVLVNWSRMSRKGSALLWLLVFPLTLLNVAYEMRPEGNVRRAVHVTAVWSAALVMTVLTTCWGTAIVETVLRFITLPESVEVWRRETAVGITASVLVVILLIRVWQERESRLHVVSAIVHSSVVLGVSGFGYFARPSEWQVVDDTSVLHFFTQDLPTNLQLKQQDALWFEFGQRGDYSDAAVSVIHERLAVLSKSWLIYVDPAGSVAGASLVVMLTLAAAVVLTWRPSQPGPSGGAAFAIILGISLLILTLSCVHAGLTQLLMTPRWGVIGLEENPHPDSVWLMRLGNMSESSAMLPLLALGLVIANVLALAVSVGALSGFRRWRRRQLTGDSATDTSAAKDLSRWRWIHTTIGQAGRLSWSTAAIALTLCGSATAAFLVYVHITQWCDDTVPGDCEGEKYSYAPVTYSFAIALGVFFLIRKVNTTPVLRKTVEGIADIACFWPITLQPLGARTYRTHAIDGIADALKQAGKAPTVLVGHSQGSVLAPWTLTSDQTTAVVKAQWPDPDDLVLVTCGSPLESLYATFFPHSFNRTWFADVNAKVKAWQNFWRDTDPIASALPYESIDSTPIPDPPGKETKVFAHSDYWIAEEQRTFISRQSASAAPDRLVGHTPAGGNSPK
ncbi:hypothetical protein C6A86_001410 [Mycobacterium sp. ITM-2016-00316]|uniref:hypothetical protein n=1 Tax=Mycobacterium sp. ITM-2016-00316 TaxID=2099695 RepID=UPI00115B8D10|nr:hypothetical protein [Mycobacterium sp. ITM-2016-00316]WNG82394.1 hypothetical protein C6A86_001410 [Mycobacterium sp. ITM-2016-00316]